MKDGKKELKKKRGKYVRSARLDVAPVGAVDLVHLGKVAHVGQEDVDLDDLLQASAGSLEDGRQVLDALVLLSRNFKLVSCLCLLPANIHHLPFSS